MRPAAQHELTFFRGFLANPRAVGAAVPSSRALAAAIAAEIPLRPGATVLELGAGTGAVTQAILDHGIAAPQLSAVEFDPGFVALLRRTFAQARILEGDAFAFGDLLRPEDRFDAIISGLPVIGRSTDERAALLRMALQRLKPQSPFVQFSYAFWSPYPAAPDVAVRHAPVFWRNVPPMHIWVYRRRV